MNTFLVQCWNKLKTRVQFLLTGSYILPRTRFAVNALDWEMYSYSFEEIHIVDLTTRAVFKLRERRNRLCALGSNLSNLFTDDLIGNLTLKQLNLLIVIFDMLILTEEIS